MNANRIESERKVLIIAMEEIVTLLEDMVSKSYIC